MNDVCRLSVIIPTYRRGEHLLETLDSVMRWLGPWDELLIVDQLPDHSADVQRKIVEWTRDSRVRLWQLPQASTTLARNFGGLMARAPVLVYLDDDVNIEEGFLESHLAMYDSDEVQAVAGRVIAGGIEMHMSKGRFTRRRMDATCRCDDQHSSA